MSLNQEKSDIGSKRIRVEAAMKGNRKRDKHKPRPFAISIQYQQALQCLTEGHFKTVVACEKEGRLEYSGGELGSDQLRYERRFAPFSVFSTPPVVRYGQFIAMTTVPPHITAQAWAATSFGMNVDSLRSQSSRHLPWF
ncbi:unnamed protein product, partial [Cyprideis torosa]